MELKVLGTDELKSRLVIFYIDRGESLNAYVWVDEDGGVRITDIYGLASYCNHSVSPVYVGDDIPEEMVSKAIEILRKMPPGKVDDMINRFNKRDEEMRGNEEQYKEREEYEDGCIKDIQENRGVKDGMFWFM